MNEKVSNKLKEKWKKVIKTKILAWNDKGIKSPNWEKEIDEADTYQKLNQLGFQLIKEIASNTYLATSGLHPHESNPLLERTAEILDKYRVEKEIEESKSDALEKTVKNIEDGLRKIVGNDLNDWESKVVKVGSSNKDIADLQTQITNLTKLKEETEKQLKEKQDQILNHRCDTPNNAELNQTKEELNKTNKEIIFLKEQLDNKPNNPLPNSPNDKEEEKKEEQENNNLTLEQLKAKLNANRQEIKMLKEQLNKTNKISQSDNHSHQNSNGNSKIFLGIVIGILIIVVFKGLAFIISKKKKKKQLIYEANHHSKKFFSIFLDKI